MRAFPPTFLCPFLLLVVVMLEAIFFLETGGISSMVIKMKGIFKGLKIISQLFALHKEHEMEIGYPTDVRHVSHIGLGTTDTCPSWMSEFRGLEELSAGSMSSVAQSRQTSWASLDFEQPPRSTLPIEFYLDSSGQEAATSFPVEFYPDSSGQEATSFHDIPRGPKKARRKKKPRASSSPSSSARSRASFATACGDFNLNELQTGLRVA